MWIYKLTNKVNGKIYIGQTAQPITKRIWDYKSNVRRVEKGLEKNRPILSAISKYGMDNFSFEILCQCFSTEELDAMEIFLIALYRCRDTDIGYNITMGGEGGSYWLGRKRSKDTIKKMSDAFKGVPIRPDVLAKRIGKSTGEQNNSVKLTWDIVRLIRSDHSVGNISLAKLAKKYHISKSMIFNIVSNLNWKE